jgi:transcriptional regulator GlxA family with amidase domain
MVANKSSQPAKPMLSVAFILLPEFTLSALAGFVDTLRLSADDNFESGQKYISWTILNADLEPVRSSCGAQVMAWERLRRPIDFDCLVVIGGLVRGHEKIDPRLTEYIAEAYAARKLIIGLCTGSFALAYAGIMKDKTTCVHWFHKPDFQMAFPNHHCVTDVVIYEDDRCLTAAGGGVSGDAAARVIERYCGKARARIGASGMLMEAPKGMKSPQPHLEADWFQALPNPELRRAILVMDRNIGRACSVDQLAHQSGLDKSKFDRLFRSAFAVSASHFYRALRVAHANRDVIYTQRRLLDIATEYGFADASHFTKIFRELVKASPSQVRALGHEAGPLAVARAVSRQPSIIRALMAGQLFFSSTPGDTGAFERFNFTNGRVSKD